jgi:hypothetical protein
VELFGKFFQGQYFSFIIFLFLSDALLADLQNTVPGTNQSANGTNGTSGYGCLKGAKKKEPQVRSIFNLK